jgi:hypothetical protein
VDVYTTSTVPKYQAPYVATDVDTTGAIPTVSVCLVFFFKKKVAGTPSYCTVRYQVYGVAGTYEVAESVAGGRALRTDGILLALFPAVPVRFADQPAGRLRTYWWCTGSTQCS